MEWARRAVGLTQGELARRAHMSRPSSSAYENGRKAPSLETLEQLLGEAGFDVEAVPRVAFVDVPGSWSGAPRADVDAAVAACRGTGVGGVGVGLELVRAG
ncbi:helix-turn-helix transcriptional regulator [Rhodococcus sp. BGS-1C]|uniref:helix-turn-helix transcriptional regulator n=2 Tax=unclassified Rhodococcus (in: high G+C Gram-positive bacteria) TaxID=192944 RepID=UPI0019D3109B